MGTGRKLIDHTGRRSGRLSVLRMSRKEKVYETGTTTRIWWLCRCDCGVEVELTGSNLRNGQQSCGCAKSELCADANIKHGQSRKMTGSVTPEYRTWCKIKERCHNQSDHAFPDYGGRGIVVCSEWLHDFERFRADMGTKPTSDHQIERIDNDGPYSLENCKWATRVEQANNKRNNVFLTYEGESRTIAEWARVLGVKRGTIAARVDRGWGADRVIGEGLHYRGQRRGRPT